MASRLNEPEPDFAVSLRGLRRSFGPKEVLRGIDLDIAEGEFVALVGKSGCGKSTLLRLVAGLDTPTDGAVRIDGRRLTGLHPGARVMFQDARLLPWKRVRDNVGLGLRAKDWKRQADAALGEVGLADRGDEWPAVLSGGQRQRAALARALVRHPQLLLLDEPLGALDALTRIEMQRLIERVWREHGFTTILITHDVEEAVALADRIVLIEEGQIALDVPVNLPRPRARGGAEFAALKDRVLGQILGDEPPLPDAPPARESLPESPLLPARAPSASALAAPV